MSGSAEPSQPIEQPENDRGAGQRQQQPVAGGAVARSDGSAAFFAINLPPPGVLGALNHDPRLSGGAPV
jgi:hypothetical protein